MLKLVFCGSPEFAAISLEYLISRHCKISAVVTMPDKKTGRGQKVISNPVKKTAILHNIPVLQPVKATDDRFLAELKEINPDLIIVVAYGKILRKQFIDIPRLGCINLHASLLPDYRGPSPIQAALLNGDAITGVTTFRIDEGMDTGDIIMKRELKISPDDNFGSLHDKLAHVGAQLLFDTISLFEKGIPSMQIQPAEGAVYTTKITPEMANIDWSKDSFEIHNLVRAMSPAPGARTYVSLHGTKMMIKILSVKTIDIIGDYEPGTICCAGKDSFVVVCDGGAIEVLEVQLEGKQSMMCGDFLRGHRIECGMVLG